MVSELIEWERDVLLMALFWGMLLAAEYDCIRIFRRVVRHRKVWTMSAEDILFWVNAGITVFCVIYEMNNGIVRGFSIAGFIAGAVLYRFAFGIFFVKYGTKLILFVLKPLKKIWHFIRMTVEKLFGRLSARYTGLRTKRRNARMAKKAEQAKRKTKKTKKKPRGQRQRKENHHEI